MGKGTIVYLSGPQAERLRGLEAFNIPIKILGANTNQASAFKVVYAGLTKGLQGLFCELLMGARKFGLLNEIRAQYEESFPGLLDKVSVEHRRLANSRRPARRGDGRAQTHFQCPWS